MNKRYYLDSCIWRDYFENRSDKFRPLGDWALALIKKIIGEEDLILYSRLTIKELSKDYDEEKIGLLFSIVPIHLFVEIKISEEDIKEANYISKKLKIPHPDALHSILAKRNKAIFVTRDKHFYELENQLIIKKPEELI